jgi:hypothetical protein
MNFLENGNQQRKMNMRFHLGLALFTLTFVIAACNLAGPAGLPVTPPAEVSPSPVIPTTTVPAATDTPPPATDLPATETPVPEVSPTLLPSPTPGGEPCLASQPQVSLQAGDFAGFPQSVLDFLNAGGSLEALDQGLYTAGVANQPLSVAAADLTGDGSRDVVVSIYNPDSIATPPGGRLLIYTCESGQYRLAYDEQTEDLWGAPGIRYLQDLDNDESAELVASRPTCGAHTCFEDITILVWDGSTFENRLEWTTTDLPYPDVRLEDPEGDGIYDLIVVGSGFGSVGAGPQRSLIRSWVYEPEMVSWIPAGETLGESNYRIHILHDAETSALVEAYDEALLLYGRVVQDSTLEDWTDPETERANLGAYALFKTAVVYLLQGNQEFAQSTFDQQEEAYPAGSTGHTYVEMAQTFQEAYAGEESVIRGCAAAQQFAGQHEEEILEPLGPAAFGYANPEYEPMDICPWE